MAGSILEGTEETRGHSALDQEAERTSWTAEMRQWYNTALTTSIRESGEQATGKRRAGKRVSRQWKIAHAPPSAPFRVLVEARELVTRINQRVSFSDLIEVGTEAQVWLELNSVILKKE